MAKDSTALELSPAARAYVRTAVKVTRDGKFNMAEVARRHGVTRQTVRHFLSDPTIQAEVERRVLDNATGVEKSLRRIERGLDKAIGGLTERIHDPANPLSFEQLGAVSKLLSDLQISALRVAEATGGVNNDGPSQHDIDAQQLKDRLSLRRFIVKTLRRPGWGVAVVRLIERIHGLEAADLGEG